MGLFDIFLSPSQKCEKDIIRRLDAFAKDLKKTLPRVVATGQSEEVVMPIMIVSAMDSAVKTLMEDRSSQVKNNIPNNIYEKIVSKAIYKVYTKHFPNWSTLVEVHSNKELEKAILQIDKAIGDFSRVPQNLEKDEDPKRRLLDIMYPDKEKIKRELDKDLDKVNSLLQETTQSLSYIKQNGSRDLSKDYSSKVALLAMNKIVVVVNKSDSLLEQKGLLYYSSYPDYLELKGLKSILERSWDTISLI